MRSQPLPVSYSRFARTATEVIQRPQPKATTAQSALEYALFAVFGTMILLAAVALYITNTKQHRAVPNRISEGITADRVNVLLLATRTEPNTVGKKLLTESLLLFSVKPSTGQLALVSIPRDLWVDLGAYGPRRLGAAHAVGDSTGYPGQGAGLTTDAVERVTGQPVHAYLRLDVGDLARGVDAVGGIDVDVQRGVYEFRAGDRFQRGLQHMDGKRAMRYAHSAYVAAPAGERFAREERQREVLTALLTRVAQGSSPVRLNAAPLSEATNLTQTQVDWLTNLVRASHGEAPRPISLARHLQPFRVNTVSERGEAVRPLAGNFADLHLVAANVFAK